MSSRPTLEEIAELAREARALIGSADTARIQAHQERKRALLDAVGTEEPTDQDRDEHQAG